MNADLLLILNSKCLKAVNVSFSLPIDISVNENGWIKWYCNLEDHHFFCEIDEFFIAD